MIIGCIFVLPACSDVDTVTGNGKSKTELRHVNAFKRLDANLNTYFSIPPCKYWVTIDTNLVPPMKGTDGPTTVPVKITADENILPLIRTEVRGDELKMDLSRRVRTDLGIRVEYWTDNPSSSSSGCTKTMMSFGGARPPYVKSK